MFQKLIYIVIAISVSSCAIQPHKSQDESTSSIKIPKNFYAEELGQCKMRGYKSSEITATSYRSEIDPIIGFDWQKHHTKYSTSMRVEHQPFSSPIAYLSAASHHAAYSKNDEEIQLTKEYILNIAKSNQFTNTISYDDASRIQCYGGNNNTSAPCPFHAPQFVGFNMTTYLISALWLKDYFTKEEFNVLNPYIKKIYFKYIYPGATNKDDDAFTAMANLGIGRLAYAAWTNDTKLAEDEFRMRFKQMDNAWEENGYIKGNSYRGVRGIFYHSLGVDIALGYIQLAKVWGHKAPDKLMVKVKKSAELINAYIDDPKNYYTYPESKIPFNASKNPADATGIHGQAFALKILMKNVVDVDMKFDREFENMSRGEIIDVNLGFNPKCMSPH